MFESIIALIAFVLIICFDVLGDKIKFHWKMFVFRKQWGRFWQPISWQDKYEKNPDGTLKIVGRRYVRKTFKFIFTFTLPVMFTNGWHLIKAAKIFAILLPISIVISFTWGWWWLNQIIAIIIWSVLWEWLFTDILEEDG